jgi:hypothetical protein
MKALASLADCKRQRPDRFSVRVSEPRDGTKRNPFGQRADDLSLLF